VSAYRIQKLREGHQALPVGGGPRDSEWFREDFRALLELLRRGEIHPVVAERLPLTDARRAHEVLESSAAKGKLVLGAISRRGRSLMARTGAGHGCER